MAEASPGGFAVQQLGLRFNVVSFLPTVALVGFVLILIGSGAPEEAPNLATLRASFDKLSARELATLSVMVVLISLVLHPFQLGLVRLLEGYWGISEPASALGAFGVEVHRRRIERLTAVSLGEDEEQPPEDPREAARHKHRMDQRAEAADRGLASYPAADRLLPTRLGNTLRAAEDEAGQRYGLATVTMWPRLYPYLSERLTQIVDDARNQLDLTVRLCVVLGLAALVSTALLAAHGWWLTVPVVTAALSWVAYRAAVRAAASYGETLGQAFDLHRFDMLRGLHYPLPADPVQEFAFNQRLSQFFQEGPENEELGDPYEHPEPDGG